MKHEDDLLHKRLKRLLKNCTENEVCFKSYKEMCEKLKLPVKSGDSKVSQLTHLEYFANIQKIPGKWGYAYSEVYDDPDKLMLQENVLAMAISDILLRVFMEKEDDQKELIISHFDMWRMFGMINNWYSNVRAEEIFKTQNIISNEQLSHYKDKTQRRFKDIIFSALKYLSDRSLISYTDTYIVEESFKFGEIEKREAFPAEIEKCLNIENEILKAGKCDTKTEYFMKYDRQLYYQKRLKKIKKAYPHFRSFSSGLKIITANKKWLKQEIDKEDKKQIVNKMVIDKLQDSARARLETYEKDIMKEIARVRITSLSDEELRYWTKTFQKRGNVMEGNYLEKYDQFLDTFVNIKNSGEISEIPYFA